MSCGCLGTVEAVVVVESELLNAWQLLSKQQTAMQPNPRDSLIVETDPEVRHAPLPDHVAAIVAQAEATAEEPKERLAANKNESRCNIPAVINKKN
ncbi:hypothetical protein E3N88_22776 [Mikania micrantha]|uniref:Uncharacterized protein n=1 Tax=Mikania micrantha TaxID=192012 RepID=A0A5N6NE28_9ASTR|nr:hypothetical protein E3N88_22776 [Mikania micrantha]